MYTQNTHPQLVHRDIPFKLVVQDLDGRADNSHLLVAQVAAQYLHMHLYKQLHNSAHAIGLHMPGILLIH
jgi:hypothetical protein